VLVKRRVCGDTMVAVRMIVSDSHESLGLCSAVISARLVSTCSVISFKRGMLIRVAGVYSGYGQRCLKSPISRVPAYQETVSVSQAYIYLLEQPAQGDCTQSLRKS